jgi:hypothetical protein
MIETRYWCHMAGTDPALRRLDSTQVGRWRFVIGVPEKPSPSDKVRRPGSAQSTSALPIT